MPILPDDFNVSEDDRKARAVIAVRDRFVHAMHIRFHQIVGSIENVWDTVNSPALLATRLKNLAGKNANQWTEDDMKDIALCAMFIFNIIDEGE